MLGLTEPLVVTVTVAEQRSRAVAPGSVNEPWHSTVIGLAPFRVICGGVVSTTLTVRVLVAELPLGSGSKEFRVGEAGRFGWTEYFLEKVTVAEQRSSAVAPGSVNNPWHSMVIGLVPL